MSVEALPLIALAASGASTGLMMYGQYRKGQVSRARGEYLQKQAEIRAERIEQKAKQRAEISLVRQRAIGRRGRALRGGVRGKVAAGNVLVEFDTSIGALEREIAGMTHGDLLNEEYNKLADITDLKYKSELERHRGVLARYTGETQYQEAQLASISEGISGLGDVSDKWFSFEQAGWKPPSFS